MDVMISKVAEFCAVGNKHVPVTSLECARNELSAVDTELSKTLVNLVTGELTFQEKVSMTCTRNYVVFNC